MKADYELKKTIRANAAAYGSRELTDILIRCFNRICTIEEPNGCLSNSIALLVALRHLGFMPQLCYGLCVTPGGYELYHAWIELDGKVLDLAIFGNSHFSPLWLDEGLAPVVFEDYEKTAVKYGKFVFDEDWQSSSIYSALNYGTLANYINKAPNDGMWRLIFSLLDMVQTKERKAMLEAYVDGEGFPSEGM